MLLGPLFTLELVTHTRRVRHWIVRVLVALVMLVALRGVYGLHEMVGENGAHSVTHQADAGRAFFRVATALELCAILALVPPMVAMSLAGERSRQTIDYLLTSGLSDCEIVLGKFASRIVIAAAWLLGSLPVLIVGTTSLSVPLAEILRTQAALLTVLVSTSALSFVGAMQARQVTQAVAGAYCATTLAYLLPALMAIVAFPMGVRFAWLSWLMEWMSAATPLEIVFPQLWTVAGARPKPLLALVGIHILVTGCCVAYGATRLRSLQRALESMRDAKRKPLAPEEVDAAWEAREAQLSQSQLDRRPLEWKEHRLDETTRQRPPPSRKQLLRYAAATLAASMLSRILWPCDRFSPDGLAVSGIAVGLFACMVGWVLVAIDSATRIAREREQGTWIPLLSTPLTSKEIFDSKLSGAMLVAHGCLVGAMFPWLAAVGRAPLLAVAVVLTIVTYEAIAVCLACVGMIASLVLRDSWQAVATVLAALAGVIGAYLLAPLALGGVLVGYAPYALCGPCLLGLPWYAAMVCSFGGDQLKWEMLLVYSSGVLTYIASAMMLYHITVCHFDRFAGRTYTPLTMPFGVARFLRPRRGTAAPGATL